MQSSTSRNFLCKAVSNSCRARTVINNGNLKLLTRYQLPTSSVISSSRSISWSSPRSYVAVRTFTTSPSLHRKKKKEIAEQEEDPANSIPPEDVVNEAFDFSELEASCTKSIEKMKDELSKLRPGGRLDPEMIENLRVSLKGSNGPERLGDLATVVPKGGRAISVIVAEEENVKPVSNAISSSPYSLVPNPDSQSPLTLNVPVPPPTAESRNEVKQIAKDIMERCLNATKLARGDFQKKLRKLEIDKKTRVPKDEMMKAHKELEKKNEAVAKEVKRIYEDRLRALDR